MAKSNMTGLQRLQTRGQQMRNDTAMSAKSQDPQNKDPEGVTPGPQYQPEADSETSNPIRMKLPKGIKPEKHGKTVMHLASGHHVKNPDGSTDFHMHSLDGEPVGASDVMSPEDTMGQQSATGGGIGAGSPYGVRESLKGLSM